jgi:hypothetical protein
METGGVKFLQVPITLYNDFRKLDWPRRQLEIHNNRADRTDAEPPHLLPVAENTDNEFVCTVGNVWDDVESI